MTLITTIFTKINAKFTQFYCPCVGGICGFPHWDTYMMQQLQITIIQTVFTRRSGNNWIRNDFFLVLSSHTYALAGNLVQPCIYFQRKSPTSTPHCLLLNCARLVLTLKLGLSIMVAFQMPLQLGFFICGRFHSPHPGTDSQAGLAVGTKVVCHVTPSNSSIQHGTTFTQTTR